MTLNLIPRNYLLWVAQHKVQLHFQEIKAERNYQIIKRQFVPGRGPAHFRARSTWMLVLNLSGPTCAHDAQWKFLRKNKVPSFIFLQAKSCRCTWIPYVACNYPDGPTYLKRSLAINGWEWFWRGKKILPCPIPNPNLHFISENARSSLVSGSGEWLVARMSKWGSGEAVPHWGACAASLCCMHSHRGGSLHR
jgi:hypothetical protein